jgi:hypothetical protein
VSNIIKANKFLMKLGCSACYQRNPCGPCLSSTRAVLANPQKLSKTAGQLAAC